ncbi:hypothetical protein ACUOH2_03570 [Escherichia coli]
MQNCLMRYAYQAWKDARSSRRDKVFTPHPAWKTRTFVINLGPANAGLIFS